MQSNKKNKSNGKPVRTTIQELLTHPKPPSSPPSPLSSCSSCSSCSASCYCCRPSPSPLTAPEDEPVALPPVISCVYEGPIMVEHFANQWAIVKWTVPNFSKSRGRSLHSPYFIVGGFDFRFMVYPRGDLAALPGHCSLYLQAMNPRIAKFDCFVSYTAKFLNHIDDGMSVCRESWYRFSPKKKAHGWSDFAQSSIVLDTKFGFLVNDTLTVLFDIRVLNDSLTVSQDNNIETKAPQWVTMTTSGSELDVLDGRITWKLNNFVVFKDIFKNQKIISPAFQVGEFGVQICIYRSWIDGVEYLSMCLEGTDFSQDRNCWCIFRVSVLNQKPGLNQFYKESYGRFGPDIEGGDGCSLGWIDYMKMSQFIEPANGFFVDGAVVFSTSFHAIKEFFNFSKNGGILAGKGAGAARKSDCYTGKFTWKIENFTKLKDLLKRKRMKNLCIRSRKFQIANKDCRLLLYPRGQSQPPCYLSVFLEVTDSLDTSNDWSCFVHHRMSVINQKEEEKSIVKESQSRYSKSVKEFGWPEFMTLASLFDQDSGLLVQDAIVSSVDLLILKETALLQDCIESNNSCFEIDQEKKLGSFTWKVENFLSFKEIMRTRKIFSKYFEVGGCKLRIGVYESFDNISTYLECDPSAVSDPDKNFWVSYRMGVVNQKDPNKSLWKESSLCTKNWSSSILQFMKMEDFLEPGAGYLVRETVTFVCEILDYCPWFEFSDLEVLAPHNNQDNTSESDKIVHSDKSEVFSRENTEMLKNIFSSAGFKVHCRNNLPQPLVTQQEKVPLDAAKLAGFLINFFCDLDDPLKAKHGLSPSMFSASDEEMQEVTVGDGSSSSVCSMRKAEALQHATLDLLLDIMVKFCQTSDGISPEDFYAIGSDPSMDCHKAVSKSDSNVENGGSDHFQFLLCGRSLKVDESTSTRPIEFMSVNETDILKKEIPGVHFPPVISAGTPLEVESIRTCQIDWSGKSEELLELIVNSLKSRDVTFLQVFSESMQRTQFAQKVSFVLAKAPKRLQPDLVTLIPKLIDLSEHPLVACALLDQLQKQDAEPPLQLPVLAVVSNMQIDNEAAERVLVQASSILEGLKDEALAAAIDFLLKAASQCQKFLQAVRVVRARLQSFGPEVSTCVLEVLSRAVNSCGGIAEAMLRDIDSISEPDRKYLVKQQLLHFSDIFLLVEMLSIPSFTVEVSQAFERAIVKGTLMDQQMVMVLEKRHAQSLSIDSVSSPQKYLHKDMTTGKKTGSLLDQEVNFTLILQLARTLALSRDTRVHGFVRMLHATLFKMFPREDYHKKMLEGLVERAITPPAHCSKVNVDLDVLAFLAYEEQGTAKQVLNMMKEIIELSNVDRSTLQHQLHAKEKENIHDQEIRQAELSNMLREKAVLLERLSESEATINHLKSEVRVGKEHFAQEKMELTDQLQEVKTRLERLRSERDSKISKLSMEKKLYQDRLHDSEAQQSMLKLQKNDEMKRVVKEKNALVERLKSADATINRFNEELKSHASEAVAREEALKLLEDEVQWFKQKVEQTTLEKGQKEEQIASYEAYVTSMEAKLNECQTYISSLEVALRDEMLQHAPLYGVGLDDMSADELEALTKIHEEGLRTIQALKQQKVIARRNPMMSLGTSPAAFLPPLVSDGDVLHKNGHVNGTDLPPLNYIRSCLQE